jgi:hypothetical protein
MESPHCLLNQSTDVVYVARRRTRIEIFDHVQELLGVYTSQEDAENRIKAESLAEEYRCWPDVYEQWTIRSRSDQPLWLWFRQHDDVFDLWVTRVELSGAGSQEAVPLFDNWPEGSLLKSAYEESEEESDHDDDEKDDEHKDSKSNSD